MAFQRGNLCFVMLAAFSLSACTASTSHPSKLTGSVLSPSLAPVTASSSAAVAAASTSAPILVIPESTNATNAGTPTSSPNSSPRVLPPTALSSQDIEAGVRLTAQEFFDDLNIAFTTGDVSKITALTAPACGCRNLVKMIADTYGQRQHIVGVSATMTKLTIVTLLPSGATLDLRYTISGGRILDAAGNQINTSIANPDEHSAMVIINAGGHWTVQQNTLLNSPTK